jgi:hypothetical protein
MEKMVDKIQDRFPNIAKKIKNLVNELAYDYILELIE